MRHYSSCELFSATQWLRELRTWYPQFRIVVMHDSARSAAGARPSKRFGTCCVPSCTVCQLSLRCRSKTDLLRYGSKSVSLGVWGRGSRLFIVHSCRELVQAVVQSETGILLTTYEHLRLQAADLLDVRCALLVTPLVIVRSAHARHCLVSSAAGLPCA